MNTVSLIIIYNVLVKIVPTVDKKTIKAGLKSSVKICETSPEKKKLS